MKKETNHSAHEPEIVKYHNNPPKNKKEFKLSQKLIVISSLAIGGLGVTYYGLPYLKETKNFIIDTNSESSIVLNEDKTYTIIGAGDSLARGWGGTKEKIDGKEVPRSFLDPFADTLNGIKPGIVKYHYMKELVELGMPLSELNKKIEEQSDTLTNTPHLILFVSAEFNTMQKAAQSIRESSDRSPQTIARLVEKGLTQHRKDLKELQRVIRELQKKRNERLGEDGDLQIAVLGLPDTTELPLVRGVMKKEHVNLDIVRSLQKAYNLESKSSVKRADREEDGTGVSFEFIDTFDQNLDPIKDVSAADKFHPNQRGYTKLAEAITKQTRIIGRYMTLFTKADNNKLNIENVSENKLKQNYSKSLDELLKRYGNEAQ